MNIFVANLNFKIQNDYLKEIFEEYGKVDSAKIIMDRTTGKSKGYGFVEMPDETSANAAIKELNGAEVEGKVVVVKVANEREKGGSGVGGGRREQQRFTPRRPNFRAQNQNQGQE